MKLNEIERLTEATLAAQADDRAKARFNATVISQLMTGIDQGLQSGTISAAAPTNPASANPAPANPAPAQSASTQQATPSNNIAQQAAQIRQQKLKAGGQAAQTQMAQNSATPSNNIAQQAAQIRQQKLKAGGQAAQTQMAQNPVTPPNNIAQQAAQIRQQKLKTGGQAAQTQMAQNPSYPKPKVWRSGRKPNANPTASPISNENKRFTILNSLFENMINVNEFTSSTTPSISSYIQAQLPIITKSKLFTISPYKDSIKQLADEVESTYATDKGQNALNKLADFSWSSLTSKTPNIGVNTNQASSANNSSSAPSVQAAAPTAAPAAAANQQSTIGVKQINKIIPTLRKRDLLSVKKNVDNTLAKRGGASTASLATSSTAPAKDNIITMPKGKAGQVRASREGGVTPEEQAKFDQRVQAAMASQK